MNDKVTRAIMQMVKTVFANRNLALLEITT